MFGFLKDKIKKTIDKFSKKAEVEDIEVEKIVEEEFKKPSQEKIIETPIEETKIEISKEPIKEEEVEKIKVEDEVFEKPSIESKNEEEIEEKKEIKEEIKIPKEIVDKKEDFSEEKEKEEIECEKTETKEKEEIVEENISQKEDNKEENIQEKEEEVEEDNFLEDKEETKPLKEENVDEIEDIVTQPEKEKKGFFKKLFSKKEETECEETETKEKVKEESEKDIQEENPKIVEKEIKDEEELEKENIQEEEIKIPEKVIELKPEIVEEPSIKKEEKIIEKAVSKDEDVVDATKKKKGFFQKVKENFIKFKITDENFEELFWEFELELMESSVAISVIEKIKSDMKEKLTSENVSKKGIEEVIKDSLKQTFEEILSVKGFDLIEKIKSRKSESQNADGSKIPFVITIIGVNGSGKTTTIAKILKLFNDNNITSVVSASDTFRAAAIDQLEEHTNKLGIKLIKHDYNSDPAAVAFDAIKHAEAKNLDVVLIDTAGRLHSNTNLMDELKKVIRVAKPDLKIFVGESITGNDCVEQATEFNNAVGIDAIILSKADVDDKGGAAISISYVTKKPILYLGTGQEYTDLIKFDKNYILNQIGLN